MKSRSITALLTGGAALLSLVVFVPSPGAADRLGNVASVTPFSRAGVLGGSNAYDDYSFRAAGGSVVFATAASNFYQTSGRRAGEEEPDKTEAASAAEEEDHGKQLLCLQVLDVAGAVLCWAERPSQPGWQRDPRLACPISGASTTIDNYILRVSYADTDCGDASYPPAPQDKSGGPVSTPYLLDGSVHGVSDDGPLF